MVDGLPDPLAHRPRSRRYGSSNSAAGPQLATYVRYNALLEMDWLKNVLGLDFTADQVAQIQKIDDPSNMKELSQLGHKAAAEQVKAEHLPAAFDLEPS